MRSKLRIKKCYKHVNWNKIEALVNIEGIKKEIEKDLKNYRDH